LLKRFDRFNDLKSQKQRIHYASAMTLLQRNDGDDANSGASYLEITEIISEFGANVKADLEELWGRIVFSILVSNVDDHLRNQGFLKQNNGWALSPLFDVNPEPTGNSLKLNISENENTLSLELALSVAKFFRLNSKQASEKINNMKKCVSLWKEKAESLGISRKEQMYMGSAFRFAQ
jgi:serine/threonine-protein kinase HipA